MPSLLGKRKRGSAPADHGSGHASPQKQDARKTIIKTVEEQLELERHMKLREIKATEARIEWARAVSSGIERDAGSTSFNVKRVKASALHSYWSIGSAYYTWLRPKVPAYAQDPVDALGVPGASTIPPRPPVDFPPLSDELRASIQQIIAKHSKPLLVKYLVDPRSEPILLVLACTICKRADLSTVQGFYNHCRLAHQLSFAGHSECIEAAGHLVTKDDILSIGLDDVEIKGTGIPSVQRLFQRAVGMQSAPPPITFNAPDTLIQPAAKSLSPSPAALETDLNKTLGLHDESPALAQFLGTTARRRQIKVFDTEEEIDIVTPQPEPRRFRWLYRPRRGISPTQEALDDSVPQAILPATHGQTADTHIPEAPIPAVSNPLEKQSRFHISRRIIIQDRSRYIPLSRRSGSSDTNTHEWSLTVTAPSYMPHVSTFLQKATISTPAPSTLALTFTDAPFTAYGRAASSFLAHVQLSWAGSQNKPTTTTHWIELDPLKSGGWAAGDEQVLDVKLDKETVFLPQREDLSRQRKREAEEKAEATPKAQEKLRTVLEETLDRLLPDFPLTLSDVKGKKAPQVPYTVHTSRRKLLSLTVGRQRAIEWQRARCLRIAAQAALLKLSAFDIPASLTTGAVAEWLRERSGTRRAPPPPPPTKQKAKQTKGPTKPVNDRQTNTMTQEYSFPGIGFIEGQHNPGIRPAVQGIG